MFERAWLAEGPGSGAELDLFADCRGQPWRLDLENETRRLSICESAAVLLYDVAGKRWRPRTLGCGSRVCPVCARVRAARACGRWRPVLALAAREGAVLRHWTLTQPGSAEPGGLVTPWEAAHGWSGGTVAADGVVARAVGGEGLGAGYHRIRDVLRALRQGRRTRERWKRLGAVLIGFEWTGKSKRGEIPRWHVHVHILGCSLPWDEPDVDAMLGDWVAAVGGSRRAQHVRIVDPNAVAEVLKYPFKPSHLSQAQRIETLAYMRGMHPHHVGGPWHASARAHHEEPWSRWLAARPEKTDHLRLHYVDDDGSIVLWTGTPAQGETEFAVKYNGRWVRFWRDAAGFTAHLKETGIDLPEPDLEPGSDEDEGWFGDE